MILRPKIGFVLACVFLDALGIGLVVPVLPRLIGTLSETRDLQTWWYGAIMLSYGLMQFLSAPVLGTLSDRIGRRPVLLGGILGLGIMFAVPAFSTSLLLILLSRVIGGALSANMAVAQAYAADITKGDDKVAAFGRIGASFAIGFVLGPAIGGIFGESDPRVPFLIAATLSCLNFLYGAFVIPESLSAERAVICAKAPNPFTEIPKLLRLPNIAPLVVVIALTTLANCVLQCTWALYTEFRFGFSPREIGLTIFALGVSISLVQGIVLAWWVRFQSSVKIIFVSLTISMAALFGIAVCQTPLIACLCCCLYALAGTVSPVMTSAISNRTPTEFQGSIIGTLSSIGALMGAIAPAIGTPLLGLTAEHASSWVSGAPYFACGGILCLTLGFFFLNAQHHMGTGVPVNGR